MTPQKLLDQIEVIAKCPSGIGQIRALVTDLAVRGKLVEQNFRDDSSYDLVEAMAAYKSANPPPGRQGRSKKRDSSPPHASFPIPGNWCETRVGDVLHVIRGSSPRPKGDPKYFSRERTPFHWVKISDIRKFSSDDSLLDTEEFLTEAGKEKSVLLPKGTLVLTNSATIGVPVVIGMEGACIHDGFLAFPNFPHSLLDQKFLLIVFRSLKKYAIQEARGLAQLNLNTDIVRSFSFGVPPLEEQRRIVSKFEELMRLCDELEERQEQRRAVGLKANEAALHAVTNADSPDDLAHAFTRLASSFSDLYSTRATIPRLREAILDSLISSKMPSSSEVMGSRQRQFGDLLRENSLNGHSKRPKNSPPGTEILRISAGTSRRDAIVDEEDVKFTEVSNEDRLKFSLQSNDLLACRFNGNLRYVGICSLYLRHRDVEQIYPDKLIRFRVDEAQCLPRYVCLAMNSKQSRLQIEQFCATTAGNIGISATKLKTVSIPVPSLDEQRRVVSTIERLMDLCDHLDSKLRQADDAAEMLTAAAVQQLLAAESPSVETRTDKELYRQRAAIGAYIVKALHQEKTFGRVQLAKLFYLTQSHVGVDLALDFSRQQAGPYTDRVKAIETRSAKRKWFTTEERPRSARHPSRKGYRYHPGPRIDIGTKAARELLGDRAAELNRLLELFRNLDTEQAELVATTFAAWNDFFLTGRSPTDDEIIREVRDNWHESKKRFTVERITKCIAWIRREQLIPEGRGRATNRTGAADTDI